VRHDVQDEDGPAGQVDGQDEPEHRGEPTPLAGRRCRANGIQMSCR
jgi:hypothetical protein